MEALRPSGRMVYFFGALGGLLFGYDTGVISGALLFIPDHFKLTPFRRGPSSLPCCWARWLALRVRAGFRIGLVVAS
jgi:hypothetical protein